MSKNGVSDELAKKLDALAAHFEAACHVGDAYMVEENAADAKTLRDAAAALRSKPVAGVEVAANELGNPDEWKSKFEELASWTGSAWIAGEPSEDLRGDCYNFLCTLLGFMQSGEAAARHLSTLLPKATAPVVSEPVEDDLTGVVTAELLAEHSGCGHGVQIEQVTARLAPGDAVYVVRGKIGKALLVPKSERIVTFYTSPQPQLVEVTEEMVERAMASIEGEPDLFITKGALRWALEAAMKEA